MLDNSVDFEKLKKLQFKIMQDVAAAAVVPLMRIGDQLGLFKKLSSLGEVSPCKKGLQHLWMRYAERVPTETSLIASMVSVTRYI